MRMHNPPHPGRVLREYLGDMAVSTAAAHLRVNSRDTVPCAERQSGDLREYGSAFGRGFGNFRGALGQYAGSV